MCGVVGPEIKNRGLRGWGVVCDPLKVPMVTFGGSQSHRELKEKSDLRSALGLIGN